MNFFLHFPFLNFQFLSNRYQLLFVVLFFGQMVSYDIIALFDFDMFALKNLYAFVKLIDFQFDIGILLTILSVVVILISKLSLKIVEFIFILPFEFV